MFGLALTDELKGELGILAIEIEIERDLVAIPNQALDGIHANLLARHAALVFAVALAGLASYSRHIRLELGQKLLLHGIGER